MRWGRSEMLEESTSETKSEHKPHEKLQHPPCIPASLLHRCLLHPRLWWSLHLAIDQRQPLSSTKSRLRDVQYYLEYGHRCHLWTTWQQGNWPISTKRWRERGRIGRQFIESVLVSGWATTLLVISRSRFEDVGGQGAATTIDRGEW